MILELTFKNEIDFQKVIEWFKWYSPFSPEYLNREFKTIGFSCKNQNDADALEMNLNIDLDVANIQNYSFELIETDI